MIYGNTVTNKKRRDKLNTQTVVIYGGNEIQTACRANKIVGKRSVKSAEETGMDPHDFVHVIESRILSNPRPWPVVVKIHETGSIFIRKELHAYERVRGFENSVQMICHFSCMDDKTRWERMVHAPVTFCQGKKDSLHFIVLEYIDNGDLCTFLAADPPKNVLRSLYLQIILAIATLNYTYHVEHRDLNSGNILVGKTSKTRMHYRIQNQEYRIQTHGITPKLVDYGRSKIYNTEPSEQDVLDDVFIALSAISNDVKDAPIKQRVMAYANEHYEKNTLHNVLNDMHAMFA